MTMKLFLLILSSTFVQIGFSQKENDTVSIYRTLLDSIYNSSKVIASTGGNVMYADIYGNYDEMRRRGDSVMEAQGKIFVVWVEMERYPTSVATVLKSHGIVLDTISLEDVVWARPKNLQRLLPAYMFLKNNRAPLGYSFFDNVFKEKSAIQLSELLFLKGRDVAVAKARLENRNNKGEWIEMVILHKENNAWKVLERIKSNRR